LSLDSTTNGIREYAINFQFEILNEQYGIIRWITASRRPTSFNLSTLPCAAFHFQRYASEYLFYTNDRWSEL